MKIMSLFKRAKKIQSEDSLTNGVKMVSVADESSLYAEQFNSIRTNIRYSSADSHYKKILITSSIPSEGKSTISANLAVSFAHQGSKVLLIDADLRRPTLNKTFLINDNVGLTNILTDDDVTLSKVIYQTNVSNLSVMPSGPVPPNPTDLLGSRKMDTLVDKVDSMYDLVIIDSAPALSVTDSQILSTKLDGVILVVRSNYVDKWKVKKSLRLFKNVDAKMIGLLLNDTEIPNDVYYYSDGAKK
jgi:capsular exopolysaccharide synthesis family protein